MQKNKNKDKKASKVKQSHNYDDMRKIQETEDMGELIELSRSEDPVIRQKAAQ